MSEKGDPLLGYALKLLAGRDYTVQQMRDRLTRRFGATTNISIEAAIGRLVEAKYLDDGRFARNLALKRMHRGRPRLEADLERVGVAPEQAARILDAQHWPSLAQALEVKMKSLGLEPPLRLSDAARLSRALLRLGYDAEEVEVELNELL